MMRRDLLKLLGAAPVVAAFTKPAQAFDAASPESRLAFYVALLDNRGREIQGRGYARVRGHFVVDDGIVTNDQLVRFGEAMGQWPIVAGVGFCHERTGKPFIQGLLTHAKAVMRGDTLHFAPQSISFPSKRA